MNKIYSSGTRCISCRRHSSSCIAVVHHRGGQKQNGTHMYINSMPRPTSAAVIDFLYAIGEYAHIN